jgi:hypothetical protein
MVLISLDSLVKKNYLMEYRLKIVKVVLIKKYQTSKPNCENIYTCNIFLAKQQAREILK